MSCVKTTELLIGCVDAQKAKLTRLRLAAIRFLGADGGNPNRILQELKIWSENPQMAELIDAIIEAE